MIAKIAITLARIVITLLIISPMILLAFESFYPRPKVLPPEALVGSWETAAKTRVGHLSVKFDLQEDGTVEGTVGDATMQSAQFRKGRGWLSRALGFSRDYVIEGHLNGFIISEIECESFRIPGHFDESGIRGDFICSECRREGKRHDPFGIAHPTYTRADQPEN